jgi:hypothetical protein
VPATATAPALGGSSPAIRFSRVVFPEPDGPVTAARRPAAKLASSSSSTTEGPKRFESE